MGDTPAKRGRPCEFDREAALDQAVRLFWRDGYEATTVRDLSQALGIGQPSLYAAFGGKRALFEEAVTAYERQYGGFIEAALAAEPTAVGAMRRILTQAPRRYTRRALPPGCLVASGDAGTSDAEVKAWLARFREEKTQRLAHKISADVSAGVLPAETDAPNLAAYVMAVLNGMGQRARDGAPRAELERVAQIAVTALPPAPGSGG